MTKINQINIEEYDVEWVDLIMRARKMGLTTEDIRAFLRSPFQPAQKLPVPTENNPCMSP
ncbi:MULTISPECIES: anti-repressor SinI family protein [Bacillales]|uniref:anti-repressor SinI family protein n=1 Tax=Bacillales TaxID=1385 RepID=UPI002378AC1F|nr:MULTISPECIES: anti-repressor SinI family protein [Bacillales]MDR6878632.1 DNA-binding transcriptional MerR regulator [Bacillus sp. 3255]